MSPQTVDMALAQENWLHAEPVFFSLNYFNSGKDLLVLSYSRTRSYAHRTITLLLFVEILWICPRVAQRDAYLFKASLQAHSMLSLFSGKRSEIPLPYENWSAMKDALKPNY